MAVYITRKCPHCDYAFENYSTAWTAFGDPLITCPSCRAGVIFPNIVEWDLLSREDKITLIFKNYVLSNLATGIGTGVALFIIFTILLGLLGSSYNEYFGEIDTDLMLGLGALSLALLFGAFRHFTFRNEVRESKQRMQDLQYRERMQELRKSQVLGEWYDTLSKKR